MTTLTSASTERPVAALIGRVLRWLDGVPYTILAIPLRLAVATVFWNSAMTKLANWNTAVELFIEEYKVPVLPPEIAAYMAASNELARSWVTACRKSTRAPATAAKPDWATARAFAKTVRASLPWARSTS